MMQRSEDLKYEIYSTGGVVVVLHHLLTITCTDFFDYLLLKVLYLDI